ncbi:hypothetical protein tb265_43180 [Gemmatimonadetes bacterium T265]|nr:hypothetical protein tb265_43180 [Gemmatimonadetes bacterium T265]
MPPVLPSAPAAGRRALLVGIDAYEHVRPLAGCVNDARAMERLLVDVFDFPGDRVRVLVDAEATRDGVLAALDRLVAETMSNDAVVFYYAGHGSQMTDREGDEPSGMDSTLVPVDSGRDGRAWGGESRPNRDITDDEIALRLAALAERTPYVTVIVDACHSGTITRDVPDDGAARSRGVEPDTRPAGELPPSPIPSDRRAGLARAAATRATRDAGGGGDTGGGLAPVDGGYVLVAGCRDEERSFEYRAPAASGGAPVVHGALTYFLVQELRALAPGATYRDVFERTAARVTAAYPRQHPQLEGRVDREVLGVRDAAPVRHVRVLAVDGGGTAGDRVTLATGAALGAAAGARYAVYPPGAKAAGGAVPLGEVELVAVGAAASAARVVSGAVVPGARAVEAAPAPGLARLTVALVGPAAADAGVRGRVAASPLLALVAAAADARLALLPPRSAAGAADPVPQLGPLAAPAWALVGADGQLLAPPKPSDARDEVVANLETLARRRRALALVNPDPASALRGRLTLELLRRTPDGLWAETESGPGGRVVYEEGDRVGFRVTNHSDQPVHISLVDVGPSGYIGVLYPPPGAEDAVGPGVTFDITGRQPERRGWKLVLPAGFPFEPGAGPAAVAEGDEVFRLFVTREPVDFSFLTQQGVRGVDRVGDADAARRRPALERLLRAATGAATRDAVEDDDPPPAAGDDWTTVDRAVVVRRRSRVALAEGAAVAVGSVTLTAAGVAGEAALGPPTPAGAAPEAVADDSSGPHGASLPDPLARALGSAGAVVREAIVVTAAPAPAGRARAADARDGAPGAVDVAVADAGPGYGQLLVSEDALGRVSFHFAEDVGPAGRGGGAGAAGVRTFRVPARPAPPDAEPDGRFVPVPGAARFVLKHVVFPLLDPLVGAVGEDYAARWEAAYRPYRIRTFGPDDYTSERGTVINAERWRGLGAGRALLFVHGTFSRAHSAFGGLPRAVMTALSERYGGRLFAFDHYTLSEDPSANVERFVRHLPPDVALDLDIVCHSRGGLVSRRLAERQSELTLGARRVRVGKVVFVGAPNAGTVLADADRMGALIDTYATVLNVFPDPASKEVLQGVVTVAKQLAVGVAKGLPGLQSMCPGGPYARALNAGARDGTARYFALASDYTPSAPGLRAMLADRLMDGVFDGANDLVVPADGVWHANGSGFFPIDDHRVLAGAESVAHTEFFGSPAAQAQLLEWLGGA